MYRGAVSVRKISVLAMHLPRGAAVWLAVGGRAAITSEVEAAWMVEHALYKIAHGQAGSKGPAPTPREYPTGVEDMAAKVRFTETRAEAFRRKHHH